MNKKHIPVILVGGLGLIAILLIASLYSDLLGARVLKKAGSRVSVVQGEKLTLQVVPKAQVRKVELCVDKPGSVNGYELCRALINSMPVNAKTATITIPKDFPAGGGVVISRFRDAKGKLLPLNSQTEKIAVSVKEASSSTKKNDLGRGVGGSLIPGLPGSRAESLYVCLQPREVRAFPNEMTGFIHWKPQIGDGIALRPVGTDTWTYYKNWRDNLLEKGFRHVVVVRPSFKQPSVLEANTEYELIVVARWCFIAHLYL